MLAVLAGPVVTFFLARRTKAWLAASLLSPFLCVGFVATAEVLWWFLATNSSRETVGLLRWARYALQLSRPIPPTDYAEGIIWHIAEDGLWTILGGLTAVAAAYFRAQRRAVA